MTQRQEVEERLKERFSNKEKRDCVRGDNIIFVENLSQRPSHFLALNPHFEVVKKDSWIREVRDTRSGETWLVKRVDDIRGYKARKAIVDSSISDDELWYVVHGCCALCCESMDFFN